MKLEQSLIFIEDSERIKIGFTTRIGGVNPEWGFNLGFNTEEAKEEVEQNRDLYYNMLGKDLKHVFANQIHSNDILQVHNPGTYSDADGFVTTEPGLVLNIQTADCIAVSIFDPVNRVIGAFHSGWKSAAKKIVEFGIRKMLELGAELKQIEAVIGPGVCGSNYEVGEELLKYFPESTFYRRNGRLYFNLKQENVRQLNTLGIKKVTVIDNCSVNEANLYSYRREGKKAGRFLNFIYLP